MLGQKRIVTLQSKAKPWLKKDSTHDIPPKPSSASLQVEANGFRDLRRSSGFRGLQIVGTPLGEGYA